jgi:glycosyltransferase involved in cell wall biosynthesis
MPDTRTSDLQVQDSRRPTRPWRVAYLVTHPIHYQVPLLRRVAADPDIDLTVFFESDFSLRRHNDVEFGRDIEWDVPLLGDYRHVFLDKYSFPPTPGEGFAFWGPMNHGMGAALRAGKYDAIWVHGYYRAHHLMAIAQAKMLGMKVLLRDEMAEKGRARSVARTLVKHGLFAALDRFVDAYLTIGSRNEQYCRSLGVSRRRMFRVGYAVDNRWFSARSSEASANREELRHALGLEPGRPIVLYVAKLIPRKAPLDLLKAFAKIESLPEAQRPYLLMAGDGEMRPEVEAFLAEHKLDSVKLLGFQDQRHLAALYDLCDLFVLPSERESWGLVVNEVMNAGRGVIASDRVCSATDLVRDGYNGYVYAFADVDMLADRMMTCLTTPGLLDKLGRESRRIIDTWDFEQNVIGLKAALAATVGLEPRRP